MTEYAIITTDIPKHGGMGDTLVHCFRKGSDLGYFKALKARGDRTRLILTSHRPYMNDLFAGNPYIDTIDRNVEDRGQWLSDQEKATLTWERPEFYLDDTEKAVIRSFPTNYIAIHPWSTQPNKVLPLDLHDLIEPLCAKNRPVVLLGGTYHGQYYSGRPDDFRTCIEEFTGFEHPLFLNAVNKLSVRTQVFLASRATKFIGSQSAFACVAEIFGVPSLIIGYGDSLSHDVGFPFRCGPVTHHPHPMSNLQALHGMNEAVNQFLGDAVMKPSEPVQPRPQIGRYPQPARTSRGIKA
jgi:hypothetical protein